MKGSSFLDGGCPVSKTVEDGEGGSHILDEEECGQLTAIGSPGLSHNKSRQTGRKRRRCAVGRMCWREEKAAC